MFALQTFSRKWVLPKSIRWTLFLSVLLIPFCRPIFGQDEKQYGPKIELSQQDGDHVIDFSHLSEEDVAWIREQLEKKQASRVIGQRFPVFVDQDAKDHPRILGRYQLIDGAESTLRFVPRFPFRKGVEYQAQYFSNKLAPTQLSFSIAASKTEPTKIVQVYPTASELPENLLKFYVHFSAPMRRGEIYQFMHIEKLDGTKIELPFLEIDQELWGRDGLRLMLLLDPGRIKRGLKPREEMGPILEEGHSYRLVIDAKWKDANGNPLASSFTKTFSVFAPDEEQPRPNSWIINAPAPGSTDPLEVQLDEPCDSALLLRLISVHASGNQGEVATNVDLLNAESAIRFTPKKPWAKGNYVLRIGGELEDLCGNSVERQFDVDLFEKTERSDSIPTTEIEFKIKNAEKN